MAVARQRRGKKRAQSTGRRVATAGARWVAVALLSLIYYTSSGLFLAFAGIVGFNVMPEGSSIDTGWRIAGGITLLILGVLDFVLFPRLVRKLTGRDIFSSSHYGGYSGGGGECS